MGVGRKNAAIRRSLQRSRLPSSSKSPFALRTILFLIFSSVLALPIFRWVKDNPIGLYHHVGRYVNWDVRREEVKSAFITSWDAYLDNAWG